jgi:hypothetical protein
MFELWRRTEHIQDHKTHNYSTFVLAWRWAFGLAGYDVGESVFLVLYMLQSFTIKQARILSLLVSIKK